MISIQISHHAKQRIEERIRINENKIQKFVQKAWHSSEIPPMELINRKKYNGHWGVYKYFLGNIFVFKFTRVGKKAVLVTFFKPN